MMVLSVVKLVHAKTAVGSVPHIAAGLLADEVDSFGDTEQSDQGLGHIVPYPVHIVQWFVHTAQGFVHTVQNSVHTDLCSVHVAQSSVLETHSSGLVGKMTRSYIV